LLFVRAQRPPGAPGRHSRVGFVQTPRRGMRHACPHASRGLARPDGGPHGNVRLHPADHPGHRGLRPGDAPAHGRPRARARRLVAARRSQGITREAIWHQRTPMGTFAIVLMGGRHQRRHGRDDHRPGPVQHAVPAVREGRPRRRPCRGPAPRCDPDRRQHLLEVASRGLVSWPGADPGRRPRPSRTRR
jgi:hypothetical protein